MFRAYVPFRFSARLGKPLRAFPKFQMMAATKNEHRN